MRILASILLFMAAAPAEEGRWAFQPAPDDFRPDALLDLRSLNEKVAGESGFVRVDASGDFVLGNGKPVRFWAVNTTVAREWPFRARPLWPQKAPDLERHARFLAKRGVNMVRLHAHINPEIKPDTKITDINPAERDWIWRTVAAMKKAGIYTTISPYWPNTMQFNPAWNYPGGADQAAHGLLFFEPRLQAGYLAWLKALFAEVNPYTGIPLAADPAVAIIQLQNEDSLLFWTVNNIRPEPRRILGKSFCAWVESKYGSIDAAYKAWSGNTVKGDDPQNGYLEFHNLWEMTQNRTGGFARRLDDQLQFWTETMLYFNGDIAWYLREELGCRQLINSGNWKSGDPVRLEDAEKYSYTATEVLAKNRYFTGVHNGVNRTWAIVNGDEFTSPSILLDPLDFPLNLRQVRGRPMMVTESVWVMPMAYATEGPFLVAAYQSLTGIDAYYWFNTWDEEWSHPQSANGYLRSQQKWMFANPDMLGNFPAAALMYRMGYVRQGDPVVLELRELKDLWQRRTPLVAETPSFDPNRDAGDIAPQSSVKTGVDVRAFLVGPVEVVFDRDPAQTEVVNLAPYLLDGGKIIRSITGELELNTDKGCATLDAPKAQGVAAFFKNRQQFKLTDVEIISRNDYGAVLVVSMDDKPLRQSARILVQAGTQSRPSEWQEQPKQLKTSDGRVIDAFEVVNFGKAPWQVIKPDVEITVSNTGLAKAIVLDMNGNARGEAPLTRNAAGVKLRFPEDAMYVVLQ